MSGHSTLLHGASILDKYYSRVQVLCDYLNNVVDSSTAEFNMERLILNESDSQSYSDFLKTTYIGVKSVNVDFRFQRYPPDLEMRQVLDRAQLRLFRNKRPQNIITAGYRPASYDGDKGRYDGERRGIANYFLNTVVTAFQAPEWEILLIRIGVDAMIHLLTQTSIFLSLPNGCLCQVAGEPVIHAVPEMHVTEVQCASAKRQRDQADYNQRPRKCRKLEGSLAKEDSRKSLSNNRYSTDHLKESRRFLHVNRLSISPAKINFLRVRLFYSRPNFIPHTNRIVVGLPPQHVLNRIYPSYLYNAEAKRTGVAIQSPRQVAEQVRHLSKYIFARQYGLNTPFLFTTKKNASLHFGDFLDRESEIKAKGPCKTPKRLKDVLPHIEKMMRRHARCGYIPMRDIACPSKVKNSAPKDIHDSVILEMMSETSIQLRSQVSLAANTSIDSAGNPIPAMGQTQARKFVKQKPRFVEFACTHQEVFRYIVLVTNAIIPKSLWGSKSNLKLVFHYVKEFISCRRHETLNLHYILQKFSTTACDWLSPSGNQSRVSVSDSLKRRELLEDFLFWYFDSFVLPLLKTTFYVTDSSAFRNHILYFRHDDWAVLCAPLIERLTSSTFEQLTDAEATQILGQRKLGFSFVRLLPKDTGVRPIVNLRRKKSAARGSNAAEQSINQILHAAFAILTYERTNQPERLGASTFGPDDIYCQLRNFKANLPRDASGALPKLYFVKLDVQACFDTIEQTKLLQILRELITEDKYMMQKYGQIRFSADKVKRTYIKKAFPENDHPHFLRQAADLANVLRNTIFVDQVVYPLSKRQDVLDLLEEHITENIVKIGRNYYRQVVGIPQGSVLSSILCSFFYGDLEKQFTKFREGPHNVLLRLIDDYLFISTNKQTAAEFLDVMKKGHPEYGCFISQEKTLTTFEHGDNVLNVIDPSQRTFPWCGYAIDMRDLSVTADYTRYKAYGIRSTMTVDRGRRPGVAFKYKLLQLAQAKSHPIFSDRDLNTEHVVYLNIYQNLLMTAMKTHEYLREWNSGKKCNSTFLRNVVEQTILYNYTTIRGQARRKGAKFDIDKRAVLWLGNHAFHHILSRVPQKYESLVAYLNLETRRAKYRQCCRRFKALVKEGQSGLRDIPR